MVANRKLGSGCTCVAVVIGGGDGIASTPIAVLVAAADPGPASTGTSATTRNRMPRLRQSKLPARACGAALAQASATSIRMSDTDAGNARHAATTLRRGHADACTRFMAGRSEEHTSELQSLMRIWYAVFCLKKKTQIRHRTNSYGHR